MDVLKQYAEATHARNSRLLACIIEVVRKGVCGDLIYWGLSSPVLGGSVASPWIYLLRLPPRSD
jgi:hypothetical protein